MSKAAKYLLLSLGSFNLFVLVCYALQPSEFGDGTALSYFGTTAETFAPYAAGVLLAVYFLFKAAASLTDPKVKAVRRAITVIAWAFLACLATPYSMNGTVWLLHGVIVLFMFATMLFASIYVVIKVDRRPRNLLILALHVVALVLMWFSTEWVATLHMMGLAQLLMDWAFVALMCSTLSDVYEAKVRVAA